MPVMLTPESRGFGDELDYFITTMPGWSGADEKPPGPTGICEAETSIDAWLRREPMPLCRNDIAGLRGSSCLSRYRSRATPGSRAT